MFAEGWLSRKTDRIRFLPEAGVRGSPNRMRKRRSGSRPDKGVTSPPGLALPFLSIPTAYGGEFLRCVAAATRRESLTSWHAERFRPGCPAPPRRGQSPRNFPAVGVTPVILHGHYSQVSSWVGLPCRLKSSRQVEFFYESSVPPLPDARDPE